MPYLIGKNLPLSHFATAFGTIIAGGGGSRSKLTCFVPVRSTDSKFKNPKFNCETEDQRSDTFHYSEIHDLFILNISDYAYFL
jgi:hypothetical protein